MIIEYEGSPLWRLKKERIYHCDKRYQTLLSKRVGVALAKALLLRKSYHVHKNNATERSDYNVILLRIGF